MTIVESRLITGGVDTHADTHVVATLDPIGGLLGVEELVVPIRALKALFPKPSCGPGQVATTLSI